MKHFDWMVFDHIDRTGIWFKGSRTMINYVFHWNPIRAISSWLTGNIWFGWFPFSTKHIITK